MRNLSLALLWLFVLGPKDVLAGGNPPQFLFLSESWAMGKVRNTQQFVIDSHGVLCIKRTIKTGETAAQTKYDFLSPHWNNSACVKLLELENQDKVVGSFKSELNNPRSIVNGISENDQNRLTMTVTKNSFQKKDGITEIEVRLNVAMTVLDLKLDAWMQGNINVNITFKQSQDGTWSVYQNHKPFDTIVTTIKSGSAIWNYLVKESSAKSPLELKVKELEFEARAP